MPFLLASVVWSTRIDGAVQDMCYALTLSPRGNPVVAGNYGNALYVAELSAHDGSILWQYLFAFPGDGRSNVKSVAVVARLRYITLAIICFNSEHDKTCFRILVFYHIRWEDGSIVLGNIKSRRKPEK